MMGVAWTQSGRHGRVLGAVGAAGIVTGLRDGLTGVGRHGGDGGETHASQVRTIVDYYSVGAVAGLLECGERWHLLVADVGSDRMLHGGCPGQSAPGRRGRAPGDGGQRIVLRPHSARSGRRASLSLSARVLRWVQQIPDVIHHLSVCPSHVEIKPVGSLTLDVPEQRLAVAGHLDHRAHSLSPEEGVILCDGAVEGLGGCSAGQLHLHLLRALGLRMFDQNFELLALEGSVLDRGVAVTAEREKEERGG